MRNYRFTIAAEDELCSKSLVIKNSELLHQMNNVLRIKPGLKEEISFIDGSGKVYTADLQELSKTEASFEIISTEESTRELSCQYCFYIPIIKPEAFAFMVRKLVELGAQKLVPVVFERSQKQYIEAIKKQRPRLEKIIQEATEQCEGAVFAELAETISLAEIEASADINIFANERLSSPRAQSPEPGALKDLQRKSLSLLIGPEGGFTDEEVNELEIKGFEATSLGPRLLKAETAAISLFVKMSFI